MLIRHYMSTQKDGLQVGHETHVIQRSGDKESELVAPPLKTISQAETAQERRNACLDSVLKVAPSVVQEIFNDVSSKTIRWEVGMVPNRIVGNELRHCRSQCMMGLLDP